MAIGQLGMKALEIGAGALAGKALGIGSGTRQIKQQQKLQDQQIRGNKEMADYNQQKQMEMWRDTNYSAQREQMMKAGLNPGLMYGMSGGGGTTTGSGSGGSVQGATADGEVARTGMGLQMATQLALLNAQKENIEADTENKKALTGKTGVETQTGKIDLEIKELTKYDSVTQIQGAAEKMIHDAEIAGTQSVIAEKTAADQISKIKTEAIGAMIENEAKKSGINVNNQRIREIANQIEQRWRELELTGESIKQSRENMERLTEAMLWGAGINAAGNLAGNIVNIATKPTKTRTTKSELDGDGNWKRTTTIHEPNMK